jgi:hypothetical protein
MNLVAAMRAEYQRGEALLWIGAWVKAMIYVTTLATITWNNRIAGALFLVLACVGQVFLFVSRLSMDGYVVVAERLRRLAMLQDGIGREPTSFELADLPERVWNVTRNSVPDPYYSSKLPKGSKRLVDITAECAFFSSKIAHAAWMMSLVASVAASGVLLLSLVLVAVLGASQSRFELVAKWVLIGITFWMTENLIDAARRYRSLATRCESILQECFRLLKEQSPSMEEAYIALHEYDAAVAGAPPLPSRVYKRRNERLTGIWQEARLRHATN